MGQSPRLLRPAASGFSPKSIAGLALWLDVSRYSSLTFNGSKVSQVRDLSGNGYNATQTTANNQPTYQADAFNGKPCVRGTGSELLICGQSTPINMGISSLSVFAAYRINTWQTGTAPLNNPHNLYHSDYPSSGTTNFGIRAEQDSNNMNARVGDADSSAPFYLGLTSASEAQPAIHTATVDGSSRAIVVRVSGVQKVSNTVAAANLPATFGARFSVLAGFSATDSARFFRGDVAEFLVYSRVLSLTEIQAVETYMSKKYGITI